MTPEEAKKRIAMHNEVHQRKEPFAVYITEALYMAMDALDKMTPKAPKTRAMDGFDAATASHLVCPGCSKSVTNYWAPGTKPAYCQFCGQALRWKY